MNAADAITFTTLHVVVIVAIATTLAFVVGMMFGGRARDDMDAAQAGRDIAGEARAGRIERRRTPRRLHVPAQPVDFERSRT
jgi:hypothetical protein